MQRKQFWLYGVALVLVIGGAGVWWSMRSNGVVPAAHTTTTVDVAPKTNLHTGDRAQWFARLQWPQPCEDAYKATYMPAAEDDAQLVFYALAEHTYLVEVHCAMGAYQGFAVYYYLDERTQPATSRMLTLPTYDVAAAQVVPGEQEEGVPEVWGTVSFDDATEQLDVLNRFRGAGDCGEEKRYRFEKDGTPVLIEYRMQACDAPSSGEEEEWKQYYGEAGIAK